MAVIATDILLDETSEDLVISNGDLKTGDSDQQHIAHLLKAKPGQYYQYPLIGLGIIDLQAGSVNPLDLKQDIKLMLKADNYRPTLVRVTDDFKIFIDAERVR